MRQYSLGFVFSPTLEQVALIQKASPAWQAGLINGIGGKLEDGETFVDAQRREFREEAGVDILEAEWLQVALMSSDIVYAPELDNNGWTVGVFAHAATSDTWDAIRTVTHEPVIKMRTRELCGVIPNLYWLVPMAIGTLHNVYDCKFFSIREQPYTATF